MYTPTTLRVPVTDPAVRLADVVGVELTGRDGRGSVDVRRVDLLTG
ncbi:hypothetical protein [Agilicoccus flavus]|nr:hypothetical protein [Agilicoccus flavus]